MSKDEIIKMAIRCQLLTTANCDGMYMETLHKFAALVAAAEREAICSIVYGHCGSDNDAQRIVDAIRARSAK